MTPDQNAASTITAPAPHGPPCWDRDGHDWPNRFASRFVTAAGIRWHVQQMGEGPVVLLVHGTGAATHSWRDVAPVLATHFTVVAPDLPGHGFTEAPPPERLSLDAMAEDLGTLLKALDLDPVLVAGHSAGAAVLARMCLDGRIAPSDLVGLNGAMLPIDGFAGRLMMPLARAMAASAVVPRLFCRFAGGDGFVERMIDGTGSRLDPAGVEFYRRLTCRPGHVASAIRMMANWKLRPLAADLPKLSPRLVLVTGGNDKTIAPRDAERVHAMVPRSMLVPMPGLGHLAHEERPQEIGALMVDLARAAGLLPLLRAVTPQPVAAAG